jgi:hypothetical protein
MLTFSEIQAIPGIRSEIQSMGFPAVLKYLRDRGITEELMEELSIHVMPASELMRKSRGAGGNSDDRLAAVFPHFNTQGDYISWWSARLVDTNLRPVVASISALVPHKRGKMFCPPNEPPHAYLPPILDWRLLQRGDKVYIHESCIKAINGARLGYWSVGLNGVWGWGSRKHSLSLVSELRDLPWRALQLQPIIVFDSNADDNWDVQAAISQLAAKLLEITGQHARHILLPRGDDGQHLGFDDYAVRKGDDAARSFLEREGDLVEVSGINMLKIKLNSEVCVVRSLGRIADQQTGALMTRAVFVDTNYAHYVAEVEDRWVNVPKLWLSDEKRSEVDTLTYAPGQDRIHDRKLNLWKGMPIEPEQGDVSMWLQVLEHNIKDPKIREWVIKWMAYPLQNLGQKMHSFIHFWGPPGSGKQAVFYPLTIIYGENNCVVIGRSHITGAFNSIFANKQFINVDEIHKAGTRADSGDDDRVNNELKKLVTWGTLIVNTKGTPEYSMPNCANIVTTSNYPDSIKLDDDDRRCAVIKFGERGRNHDKKFWKEYHDWMDDTGAAAVYDYLLKVDLSDFDPKGDAPFTEDKGEMIRATRRVDEQWVDKLYDDPSDVLPPILDGLCVMTGKELAQYCYGDDPGGITPAKKNALGIRLHAAGFPKVENVKIDGRKERYWVIRKRDEEWSADRIREHLKAWGRKSKAK